MIPTIDDTMIAMMADKPETGMRKSDGWPILAFSLQGWAAVLPESPEEAFAFFHSFPQPKSLFV
jgi:hypothetical protein